MMRRAPAMQSDQTTAAPGGASGKFVITKIYDPDHQKAMSTHEVEEGKAFIF